MDEPSTDPDEARHISFAPMRVLEGGRCQTAVTAHLYPVSAEKCHLGTWFKREDGETKDKEWKDGVEDAFPMHSITVDFTDMEVGFEEIGGARRMSEIAPMIGQMVGMSGSEYTFPIRSKGAFGC